MPSLCMHLNTLFYAYMVKCLGSYAYKPEYLTIYAKYPYGARAYEPEHLIIYALKRI